jgi:hypothetical protein
MEIGNGKIEHFKTRKHSAKNLSPALLMYPIGILIAPTVEKERLTFSSFVATVYAL